MSSTRGRGKPGPDINIVPLVDVCLVLLIIFMVITPMLQQGKSVDLPVSEHAIEKDERNSNDIVVSLDISGAIWLVDNPQGGESKPYQVNESELRTAIGGILSAEPFRAIMLKADRNLTYGEVKKIMIACKESGATAVKLAAAKDKKLPDDEDDEDETASDSHLNSSTQGRRFADGVSR